MVGVHVSTTAEILKNFFPWRETLAAEENRFAAELTKDDVIKLLEIATPGNTKKAKVWCGNIPRYLSLHFYSYKTFVPITWCLHVVIKPIKC